MKLIPSESHLGELRKDYREMAIMIFGQVPPLEQVVQVLAAMEYEINGQQI